LDHNEGECHFGSGAGMNVGDAAKQARTSVLMINRTYYQPRDTRSIRAAIRVI
jgi:hypothetical protein